MSIAFSVVEVFLFTCTNSSIANDANLTKLNYKLGLHVLGLYKIVQIKNSTAVFYDTAVLYYAFIYLIY